LKPFDLATVCEIESNLIDMLDAEFVDEMECEKYLDGDF
jgi:hypothetical protein